MWCHPACGRPAGKWRVWAGHPWEPKAVEDSGMTCCWPDLQWYPAHHPPWVHRAPFQLQSSAWCCLRWASMARLSAHTSVPARDPQDAPSSCIEGTLQLHTPGWRGQPWWRRSKERQGYRWQLWPKDDCLFDRWCVREGMKQKWCGLIWINPGMQNFEKTKKQKKQKKKKQKKPKKKDLATSPDIRVVVETLFFGFFWFAQVAPVERKKSRVNPG